MPTRSVIIATGSYLPECIVTNDELAQTIDTSDEWIVTRTGIRQRHIAADDEATSDLAFCAAKNALNKAGVAAENVDAIIVATTTPDLTFPSTATKVQAKLGAIGAFAFDMQAVCSGFVYALSVADSFIKTGQAQRILVIGAEKMSSILDWQDRNTCILFGDGAGAVLVEARDATDRGIIASKLYSDGQLGDILNTTGGVSSTKEAGVLQMQGKEVFKHAVDKMSSSLADLTAVNALDINDIDYVIPHQANIRIMEMIAKRLGLPLKKLISTVAMHANSSAASIPLALDDAAENGTFSQGNLLALTALGGGITWGGLLLKW